MGGKQGIAGEILWSFPDPDTYHSFGDPFFGGGAVTLAAEAAGLLRGKSVFVGDAAPGSMTCWRAVRDAPDRLASKLAKLVEESRGATLAFTGQHYRAVKNLWNAGVQTPENYLYLRAGAFNGLWRVNQKNGHFNVDWNKVPIIAPTREAILEASRALQGAEMLAWDIRAWEAAPRLSGHGELDEVEAAENEQAQLAHASGNGSMFVGPGWLVYLDPPYAGGFTQYTQTGFSAADQEDVVRLAALWASRGATVVYSNKSTDTIHALLEQHWPGAHVRAINVRRPGNSDGAGRQAVKELIATNNHPSTRPPAGVAATGDAGVVEEDPIDDESEESRTEVQ